MRLQGRFSTAAFAIIAPMVAAAPGASAEEIGRSNWVPNVGSLLFEEEEVVEQPLGDLWTFNCPRGGTVTVSVDTKDDTDTAEADIDPILQLFDGAGNLLAEGDDELTCTYPPVCGFACPEVVDVPCGEDKDKEHSIVVRDFGSAFNEIACQEGGGYELRVEVFNADGNQLSEREVDLGGGPERKVPKWALDQGKAPVGPALDDEDVPIPEDDLAAGVLMNKQ